MTNPMSGGLLDLVGQLIGGAMTEGGGRAPQPSSPADILGGLLGDAIGGQQAPAPRMPDAGSDDLGGLMGSIGGGPMTQMLLAALGPTLAKHVADMFGIDQRTAQRVVMVAVPLLLAALARNAQNKRGANSLSSALERDHDGSALNQIDDIFANPDTRQGGKIVKKVLGNRTNAVAQTLTEQTGLDGNKLLATLAPVVLGVLGQQQRQQGYNPDSLAGALLQERNALQSSSGDLMSVLAQMIGPQARALS
jgi:Bacterial protein of unknown function (DUF937)